MTRIFIALPTIGGAGDDGKGRRFSMAPERHPPARLRRPCDGIKSMQGFAEVAPLSRRWDGTAPSRVAFFVLECLGGRNEGASGVWPRVSRRRLARRQASDA